MTNSFVSATSPNVSNVNSTSPVPLYPFGVDKFHTQMFPVIQAMSMLRYCLCHFTSILTIQFNLNLICFFIFFPVKLTKP